MLYSNYLKTILMSLATYTKLRLHYLLRARVYTHKRIRMENSWKKPIITKLPTIPVLV